MSPKKYDAEFCGATSMLRRRVWKSSYLREHHRLDHTGVGNVRAGAQVNHGSAAVDRGGSAIGDLGLNEKSLVLVVLQNGSEACCLRHFDSH